MIRSEIKNIINEKNELQRVQCVTFDSWEQLDFMKPEADSASFMRLVNQYKSRVVPKYPFAFGRMFFFRMPEGLRVPNNIRSAAFGKSARREVQAACAFRRGLKIGFNGKPSFSAYGVCEFYERLKSERAADIVTGLLPQTVILPVGSSIGFLSKGAEKEALRVNASFFIMDSFDVASPYDVIGTPFGLCIKNGIILSPPLFGREALLIRNDGSVSIESPDVRNLKVVINGAVLRHGRNAVFVERPDKASVELDKYRGLAVVGTRVVAVKKEGSMPVPASGFLILVSPDVCEVNPGDHVSYQGMKSVVFGIQVGNSLVKNGVKTTGFNSRFYNIKNILEIPYPPSLYPLGFDKDRAARIALGADKAGKPMLVWAEGASKVKYVPGEDSCGASLSEMADICKRLGMYNGVNLDGGGSAQILLSGKRALRISERSSNNDEEERPVPLGLSIKE